MPLLRYPALIIVALLLQGCSSFSILFERLPDISTWQLNRVYKLNPDQKRLVRQGSIKVVLWLRSEGIPEILPELKSIKVLWDEGNHQLATERMETLLNASVNKLMQASAPEIRRLLLTLNHENAAHFLDYNRRKTGDWYEHTGSRTAKIDHRIAQLNRWFGKLDTTQAQRIAEMTTLLPNEHDVYVENNRVWTKRMLDASLARDERALDQWLADPSVWWTEEYRTLNNTNREQVRLAVNEIIDTLLPRQNRKASKRLAKWIRSLQSVSPSDNSKTG